jgi:hypothetical protein
MPEMLRLFTLGFLCFGERLADGGILILLIVAARP